MRRVESAEAVRNCEGSEGWKASDVMAATWPLRGGEDGRAGEEGRGGAGGAGGEARKEGRGQEGKEETGEARRRGGRGIRSQRRRRRGEERASSTHSVLRKSRMYMSPLLYSPLRAHLTVSSHPCRRAGGRKRDAQLEAVAVVQLDLGRARRDEEGVARGREGGVENLQGALSRQHGGLRVVRSLASEREEE